jgi:hypothetical protein
MESWVLDWISISCLEKQKKKNDGIFKLKEVQYWRLAVNRVLEQIKSLSVVNVTG